jgi:hypothetical protein
MQYTKDSFYMALQQRLAAFNPERTITLSGATRPAVVVAENELVIPITPLPDAFYIEWGAAQVAAEQTGSRELMEIECVISYQTFGTVGSGVDRGRTLGALDTELLNICQPLHTAKRDYTQAPSVGLGTNIVWTTPVMGKVMGSESPPNQKLPRCTEGARLERSASLKVFFFPEVNFL